MAGVGDESTCDFDNTYLVTMQILGHCILNDTLGDGELVSIRLAPIHLQPANEFDRLLIKLY